MRSPSETRRPAALARSSAPRPHRRAGLAWTGVLLVWAGTTALAAPAVLVAVGRVDGLLRPLAALTAVLGALVWLGAAKQLAQAVVAVSRWSASPPPTAPVRDLSTAVVALVVCTADDLEPARVRASIRQTRPFDRVLLLDDSRTDDGRAGVDALAASLPRGEVRRREDRRGYKAGNLNAHLHALTDTDYLVVVDADEELPGDFVAGALARFAAEPADAAHPRGRLAVVQGGHLARRGDGAFADRFAPVFDGFVALAQRSRAAIGATIFMGRGAMLDTAALRAVGGVPEVVMEDVALSVELRRAGYRVDAAPELVSREDYPVDLAAFRTQQRKLAEGTAELLRTTLPRLLHRSLRPTERIDLLLEHGLIPAGAVFGAAAFGTALLTGGLPMPLWYLALIGTAAVAPILPAAMRSVAAGRIGEAAVLVPSAMVLYGACLRLTLAALVRVSVVRASARFAITPKRRATAATTRGILAADVAFGAGVLAIALMATGSPLPALGIAGPALAGPLLLVSLRPGRRALPRPVRRPTALLADR